VPATCEQKAGKQKNNCYIEYLVAGLKPDNLVRTRFVIAFKDVGSIPTISTRAKAGITRLDSRRDDDFGKRA